MTVIVSYRGSYITFHFYDSNFTHSQLRSGPDPVAVRNYDFLPWPLYDDRCDRTWRNSFYLSLTHTHTHTHTHQPAGETERSSPSYKASIKRLSILHKQLHHCLVEEVLHTVNGLRFSKALWQAINTFTSIALFSTIRTRGILAEGVVVGLMRLQTKHITKTLLQTILDQGVQAISDIRWHQFFARRNVST